MEAKAAGDPADPGAGAEGGEAIKGEEDPEPVL